MERAPSPEVKVPDVSLRPVAEADRAFLREVYAGTRAEELAMTSLTPVERERFIDQQFEAQDHHYRQHYTGASLDVVYVDGVPAGRLYIARWPTEIRIMDIALLPEWRGRGVGSRLLAAILDEGRETAKRVSIHVEVFNPAQRLYRRLGFRPVGETGVYRLMEWSPSAQEPSPC